MVQNVLNAFGIRCIRGMKAAFIFLRGNFWRILYYTGVVLALCLIGSAAYEMRGQRVENADLNEIKEYAVEAGSVQQEARTAFVLPKEYDTLRAYSRHPKWNAELGCWQSHPAVDYKSENGLVVSVSDGSIMEIGNDTLLGGYILVESGAYLICYASIEPDSDLEIGSRVDVGEEIGKMDRSLPGERYMGNHIHLEIYENGMDADPAEIFRKSAGET